MTLIAPKKQPCPECGAWVKRKSKSDAYALFEHFCNKAKCVVKWNCRVTHV